MEKTKNHLGRMLHATKMQVSHFSLFAKYETLSLLNMYADDDFES